MLLKSIFYYSNNAIDLDSLIAKSWNGSTWLNIVKREIVNDINHNQIVQIEKIWNSNSWINSIIQYFAYNKYNCIESASCEIWVNDQWTIGDGDILFQNPDGFIIGFITNDISAYYSNIVSVRDKYNSKITGYFLSQNYPNPFNPTTTITYSLPKSTFVTLKVYDIIGEEIAELVNEKKDSGTYDVTWNAQNIPSGVYFYKITAGEYSKTIKMILLK